MSGKAFVVVLWCSEHNPLQLSIEAVVATNLESTKEYVSKELENGRDLVWHDGRTFSACEPILPTNHNYTIHWVPMVMYW